jgi:solute carrier family 24 (sodium/potassium/calcium exchanger), member 4
MAAGTSMPELVSSIIVTRQGKGGMAISNSVGSNVFDILVCLGLPWLIQALMNPQKNVIVYSKGIFYAAAILFISIFLIIISFIINKWRLTKKFGFLMLTYWIGVTIMACLVEYDVFGKVSIPFC